MIIPYEVIDLYDQEISFSIEVLFDTDGEPDSEEIEFLVDYDYHHNDGPRGFTKWNVNSITIANHPEWGDVSNVLNREIKSELAMCLEKHLGF